MNRNWKRQEFVVLAGFALMLVGCGGGGTASPRGSGGDGGGSTALSFTQGSLPTGGASTYSPVIADFKGDGKADDVAVSSKVTNTIDVFLNSGNGSFGSPVLTTVSAVSTIGAMVSGDFNEDGKADLIVSAGSVDILLLGNGTGGFSQQISIPQSTGFAQARVADINGDGHKDLVTVNNGSIAAFLGNGSGSFTAAPTIPNGSTPGDYVDLAVADFNGDQKLDIVAVDNGGAGTLVFYPGNGNGSFGSAVATVVATRPESLSAADFNGDGKLDVAVGYGTGTAVAIPGNGNGTFNPAGAVTVFTLSGGISDVGVLAADISGDAKADVIAWDYTFGSLAIAVNDGTTPFANALQTPYKYTLATGLNRAAIGDLNGDGLPDLVVANDHLGQVIVLLSKK